MSQDIFVWAASGPSATTPSTALAEWLAAAHALLDELAIALTPVSSQAEELTMRLNRLLDQRPSVIDAEAGPPGTFGRGKVRSLQRAFQRLQRRLDARRQVLDGVLEPLFRAPAGSCRYESNNVAAAHSTVGGGGAMVNMRLAP